MAEWIGKETGACLGYRYPETVNAKDIAMFHVKHLGQPKDQRSNQRKPMARKITHRWVGETDFSNSEQGFVAGYLAHLVATKTWKQMNREIQRDRGLSRWKDLSFSAVVILTVFNEMVLEATGQVEENNCSSASIPSPIMVKERAI